MTIKFVATHEQVTAVYDDGTRRAVPMQSDASAEVGRYLSFLGMLGLVDQLDPRDPEVTSDTIGGYVVDEDLDPDFLAEVAEWPLVVEADAA